MANAIRAVAALPKPVDGDEPLRVVDATLV